MKATPLFFNLNDKTILIVGAGKVALRKARFFAEAGAKLTVIAPKILPEFSELPIVTTIEREVRLSDISKAFDLVLLATSSPETNKRLGDECKRNRVFCCRTDDFRQSDFFTSSTLNAGAIELAIYSSGVPEMSKFIKDLLAPMITDELAELAEILAELRPEIKKKLTDEKSRKDFFRKFLNEKTLIKIKENGGHRLREEIIACL
jgi:siroheme synthase-like protein